MEVIELPDKQMPSVSTDQPEEITHPLRVSAPEGEPADGDEVEGHEHRGGIGEAWVMLGQISQYRL